MLENKWIFATYVITNIFTEVTGRGQNRRKEPTKKAPRTGGVKKPHRYRPGIVAL